MITVRNDQMDAFKGQALARFEDKMVARIAETCPARFEALGEPGTRKLVRKGIETGRPYGIQCEGAVAVLIELMAQFGEKLEMSPDRAWAFKIMEHPKLPDYIKMDIVRERLTAKTGGRTLMPPAKTDPTP